MLSLEFMYLVELMFATFGKIDTQVAAHAARRMFHASVAGEKDIAVSRPMLACRVVP